MKRKQIQELHQKETGELRKLLSQAQDELVKLRMDLEAKKIKDVHALTKKRDEIARIKTILKEKESMEESLQTRQE